MKLNLLSGNNTSAPHYHRNRAGILVTCYHQCRSLMTDWRFWCGLTLGYPLEHYLWEKVWPFNLLTHFLHLH